MMAVPARSPAWTLTRKLRQRSLPRPFVVGQQSAYRPTAEGPPPGSRSPRVTGRGDGHHLLHRDDDPRAELEASNSWPTWFDRRRAAAVDNGHLVAVHVDPGPARHPLIQPQTEWCALQPDRVTSNLRTTYDVQMSVVQRGVGRHAGVGHSAVDDRLHPKSARPVLGLETAVRSAARCGAARRLGARNAPAGCVRGVTKRRSHSSIARRIELLAEQSTTARRSPGLPRPRPARKRSGSRSARSPRCSSSSSARRARSGAGCRPRRGRCRGSARRQRRPPVLPPGRPGSRWPGCTASPG